MPQYKDVSKILKCLNEEIKNLKSIEAWKQVIALKWVISLINHTPEVDLGITYCKDCKYWQTDIKANKNRCMCSKIHKVGIFQHYTKPDHYCGYAKRKGKQNENG